MLLSLKNVLKMGNGPKPVDNYNDRLFTDFVFDLLRSGIWLIWRKKSVVWAEPMLCVGWPQIFGKTPLLLKKTLYFFGGKTLLVLKKTLYLYVYPVFSFTALYAFFQISVLFSTNIFYFLPCSCTFFPPILFFLRILQYPVSPASPPYFLSALWFLFLISFCVP